MFINEDCFNSIEITDDSITNNEQSNDTKSLFDICSQDTVCTNKIIHNSRGRRNQTSVT